MSVPGKATESKYSDWAFARKVLITLVILALFASAWMLADVLLLFFGSTLLAILLTILAQPLIEKGVARPLAVLAVAGAVLLGFVALSWFFGSQAAEEFKGLSARFDEVRQWLGRQAIWQSIGEVKPDGPIADLIPRFASWTMSVGAAVVGFVLVLVGAVYLAIDSQTYREGFLKLVPEAYLASVTTTLDDAREALARWLAGQLMVMMAVGVMTGTALWFIGLPSALALGFLAGLSNFVPYIGSIMAAAIMLVIAAAQSWEMVLWVAGVLFVIQQIESNVLSPFIAGGAVYLPPAIALYAMAVMGLLFGPLGLLFGFPLTVVIDIAIRRIYVRDTLDRPVEILGSKAAKSKP